MSCVLRAYGKAFDVEAFLADSPWRPDRVIHRGERPLLRHRSPSPDSGFNLCISDDDHPAVQIETAMAFLHDHARELRRLTACPGLDDVGLDFASFLRPADGPALSTRFPVDLLHACAELHLQIEHSVYLTTDS